MSGKRKPASYIRMLWSIPFVCALTALCCLLLYEYDNKYTFHGPQGFEGLLVLEADAQKEPPVIFLVEGWEYYDGRLLQPEDFEGQALVPDAYIYIGQYGGFEAGDGTSAPHGSASYRLRVRVQDEPRAYTLELPEIFSAYRLYINGSLRMALGDPDPARYRAEVRNRTVSFEAGGEIEILFAVTDFSHFYSGIVYPPAFGGPDAVATLLNTRLVLRSLLAAFALAIGLVALLTGLVSHKSPLAMLYGALCLCFVGYTSYPILRTLFVGAPGLYTLEMTAFCAMLAAVMLLQWYLHPGRGRSHWAFIALSVVMCLFSVLLPLLVPGGGLGLLGAYSLMISLYELAVAGYITAISIRTRLWGRPHSAVLLTGFLVFDTALVMDRLLPLYEPIVSGWFHELAGFALVLCIGIAVGQEMALQYKENAILVERQVSMERLAKMQQSNYALLMERVEETKAARHDLRHHLITINGFLEARAYDALSGYVAQYQAAIGEDAPLGYTRNMVADVLLRHYARQAAAKDIAFTVNAALSREAGVDDPDLCAVLSNLLENAVEACGRVKTGRRFISVTLAQKNGMLAIRMENSAGPGTPLGGGAFASEKEEGRIGYGLRSIRAIARRYGGSATFEYEEETGTFISTVLLAA